MRTDLVTAMLLVMLPVSAGARNGLQCPVATTGRMAGQLRETPKQIAVAGQQLGRGSKNEISQVVGTLRKRHPRASKGAVINYLITAYCPTVKGRTTLSTKAKQNAVRAFAIRAQKSVS